MMIVNTLTCVTDGCGVDMTVTLHHCIFSQCNGEFDGEFDGEFNWIIPSSMFLEEHQVFHGE